MRPPLLGRYNTWENDPLSNFEGIVNSNKFVFDGPFLIQMDHFILVGPTMRTEISIRQFKQQPNQTLI